MKVKEKLIKRTYRITKEHDKKVKKYSRVFGSESEVVRQRLDTLQ